MGAHSADSRDDVEAVAAVPDSADDVESQFVAAVTAPKNYSGEPKWTEAEEVVVVVFAAAAAAASEEVAGSIHSDSRFH